MPLRLNDAGVAEPAQGRRRRSGRRAREPRRRRSFRPYSSASSWSGPMSAGSPKTWTAAIATVRGVISRAGILHVDAVGLRIDVGEDRLQAIPAQGVDGRAKGEARHDHLAGCTLECLPGQGHADVAARDALGRRVVEDTSGPLLEQPGVLAEIREHPGLEQLGNELGVTAPEAADCGRVIGTVAVRSAAMRILQVRALCGPRRQIRSSATKDGKIARDFLAHLVCDRRSVRARSASRLAQAKRRSARDGNVARQSSGG